MIQLNSQYWVNPNHVIAIYADEQNKITIAMSDDVCLKVVVTEPDETVEQTIRGIVDKINKNL